MSVQVFSASQAIQLNNVNKPKQCCYIGNLMTYKHADGTYYCNPHSFTVPREKLGLIVSVKGAVKRYA